MASRNTYYLFSYVFVPGMVGGETVRYTFVLPLQTAYSQQDRGYIHGADQRRIVIIKDAHGGTRLGE